MVEIINNDMYLGNTGSMVGEKPTIYVLHNDAGSMSAKDYLAWLKKARTPFTKAAEKGFAHYYIDRHAIVRVQNTTKIAWAMGNSWANKRSLSYEVCQQFSTTDEELIENENMVLRQMAEDMKFYGHKPNSKNIDFHQEYVSTSCPQRTKQLHGGNLVSLEKYVINKIAYYQSLGDTVQEMLENESKAKARPIVAVIDTAHKLDNPHNVKMGIEVTLDPERTIKWLPKGSKNGAGFNKSEYDKLWGIKSIQEYDSSANIYDTRNPEDGGWVALHDLIPFDMHNPFGIKDTDTVALNGRAKYWADKGTKARQSFTEADKKKTWKIKSIQSDSTANIYNVEDKTDGGWAVLHDLNYK